MIIFLGLAGSGKSTQATRLAGLLKCPRIAIGDLLRAVMHGEEAKRMLAGELIEDEKWLPLLEAELRKNKDREFIIDGSPRTINQAEWLIAKANQYSLPITAIIHLNASKNIVLGRLLQRGRSDDYEAAINERFKEYETKILPILNFLKEQGLKVVEIDANKTEDEVETEIVKALNLEINET